ncbi:hypothetical protein [Paracoccus sp. (in: a-proteobacteria)]|uniref:hypothetical protein n=1 Tax=Paracoccus sp. TaxID=267 RepID=UPI0028A17E9A|nr:hypothetical protein [Paracoccus sp. (in: a-proteobacteria)]
MQLDDGQLCQICNGQIFFSGDGSKYQTKVQLSHKRKALQCWKKHLISVAMQTDFSAIVRAQQSDAPASNDR